MTQSKEITGMLAYIVAARELFCTSVSSKCLIQYYCSNVDEHGRFFKSTLDISIDTGVSAYTIRTANKNWSKFGLLTIIEHPWWSGKANDYKVHLGKLQELVQKRLENKEKKKQTLKKGGAERTERWKSKQKVTLLQALPQTKGDASTSVW